MPFEVLVSFTLSFILGVLSWNMDDGSCVVMAVGAGSWAAYGAIVLARWKVGSDVL